MKKGKLILTMTVILGLHFVTNALAQTQTTVCNTNVYNPRYLDTIDMGQRKAVLIVSLENDPMQPYQLVTKISLWDYKTCQPINSKFVQWIHPDKLMGVSVDKNLLTISLENGPSTSIPGSFSATSVQNYVYKIDGGGTIQVVGGAPVDVLDIVKPVFSSKFIKLFADGNDTYLMTITSSMPGEFLTIYKL